MRIVFRNLLPTGAAGDLFLPVDSSLMGAGMGPMAMADPMDEGSGHGHGAQPDVLGIPEAR